MALPPLDLAAAMGGTFVKQDPLVRAQVHAKIEDHSLFVDVASKWLLDATRSILPDLWRELEGTLPLEEPRPCAEHGHHGPPNSLYAYLAIYSRPWHGPVSRPFGPEGLEWLKEQFKDEARPLRAVLGIEIFDSHGQSDLGWAWNVWIESDESHPSWMRLGIECMPHSADIDPRSLEVGQRWIKFVQSSLRDINPSFGYIGERVIPLEVARGEEGNNEIVKRYDTLRGCSWVTICPSQIVKRFGGVEDIRKAELFYSVEQLPSGAAMLQATESLAAFGQARAIRIAKTLSGWRSRRINIKDELQARRAQTYRRRPRLP